MAEKSEKLFKRFRKSELQIKLESEGWMWITNIKTGKDYQKKIEKLYRVYEEVKAEYAYDIEGVLISDPEIVALYARGRKQETA